MIKHINTEQFINYITKIYHKKITLINPNINNIIDNITYQCNICKNEYTTTAMELLSGHWCHNCQREYPNESNIIRAIIEKIPNIDIVGRIIGTRSNVLCRCKKCNYYWFSQPNTLRHTKYGCPICRYNNAKLSMTHEEFVEKMQNINPTIIITSQFQGTHKYVNYKCKICGLEKKAIAYELLYGQQCNHKPQQLKTNQLLNKNDYYIQLSNKFNINILTYDIKSYYDLIKCKCNDCNTIFTQSANLILEFGCPHCYNGYNNKCKFKSSDDFKQQLHHIHGNKFQLLEAYINSQEYIHFQCQHNHIFRELSSRILKPEYQCQVCKKQQYLNNVVTTKGNIFKVKLEELSDNTIIMLEPYTGIENKIKFKCLICDHEWATMPSNIIHKHILCPKCTLDKRKFSINDINTILHTTFPDDHIVWMDQYKNSFTKGKCLCKKCNNEFFTTVHLLQHGCGCPICDKTISKGEKFLREILSQLNINFIEQYRFSDCRYRNTLPFDFAIFNDNNELQYLIEYDGKQHYDWKCCHGKTEHIRKSIFYGIQKRDNIKNQYCKDHNIILIRLVQWHHNSNTFYKLLKEELIEKLKQHNL